MTYFSKKKGCAETTFLTEQSLGHILERVFPNHAVRQHAMTWDILVNGQKRKITPDYTIFDKRGNPLVFVEFDGFKHFTNERQGMRDIVARHIIQTMNGYAYIQIPYFLQLDERITSFFFGHFGGAISDFSNGYPHGFINKNVVRPGDFCLLGLGRYFITLSSLIEEGMEDVVDEIVSTDYIMRFPSKEKVTNIGQSFIDVGSSAISYWSSMVNYVSNDVDIKIINTTTK